MEAGHEKIGFRRTLIALVRLQALDKERDLSRRRVDQTPRVIAARAESVASVKAEHDRTAEEFKRARMDAHSREMELRARSDEVKKLELQLNTAKTNQEYQALTHHIKRLREESAKDEDTTLALYEEIERLQARVHDSEKKLKEAEASFQEFVKTCEQDRDLASGELAGTDAQRKSLTDELQPEIRETYETLRQARDGIAVVSLDGRICTGCGINLTPNNVARVLACREIVTCQSCQRVLYVPTALAEAAKNLG